MLIFISLHCFIERYMHACMCMLSVILEQNDHYLQARYFCSTSHSPWLIYSFLVLRMPLQVGYNLESALVPTREPIPTIRALQNLHTMRRSYRC